VVSRLVGRCDGDAVARVARSHVGAALASLLLVERRWTMDVDVEFYLDWDSFPVLLNPNRTYRVLETRVREERTVCGPRAFVLCYLVSC
jgi:hypothetical protein